MLISVALIIASGLAVESMDGARKDLLTIADRLGGELKKDYHRYVEFFFSMQMSIISILISICVWLVLTIVELARKQLGISIVLVATFYTMLMLLSHGISLQTSQRQTADFIVENFSGAPGCNADMIPRLCAFDEEEVKKYEATYYLSYISVAFLGLYAAFLMFIRRVGEFGGRFEGSDGVFKSGIGSSSSESGGMSTRTDEYQGGGANADASPWHQNAAYV